MKFTTTKLPYLENTDYLISRLGELGDRAALESSNTEHPNGRWSIISASPAKRLEYTDRNDMASILLELEQLKNMLPLINSELPFTGGLIGHLSYDLGIPKLEISQFPSQPLILCGLYTWAYLIDHKAKETTLIYWSEISTISKNKLETIFNDSITPTTLLDDPFKLLSAFIPKWDKLTYKKKIDAIKHYILNGDTYQVNLAQSFHAIYQGDPISAYSKLKQAANVPFACYFESTDWSFASATPELFLHYSNNTVTTKPIKGTRPRFTNQEKDNQQIIELKNSKKDKAENLMIVDLLRNDLSKNASNVRVDSLFDIESFSTVHHLVSTISATANSKNIIKLLLDAFPGGSITGAPKKRAMEIISELEESPRSFYCGSSFYLSSNNKMSSNILIRGFLFEKHTVTCWAGGGIIADSHWEDEYQESLDKISKLMASLS